MRPPASSTARTTAPSDVSLDLEPETLAEELPSRDPRHLQGRSIDPRREDLHVRDVDVQDPAERTHVEKAPRAEHRHAVTERLRVGEDVGGEEHGLPFPLQAHDELAHQPAPDWIQPRHGLVEDDELRVVHEGLGDPSSLHHPLREAPHGDVGGPREPDAFEKGSRAFAPRRGRKAEQPSRVVHVFGGRQVIVEVGMFGQVAHSIAPGSVVERRSEDRTPLPRPGRGGR